MTAMPRSARSASPIALLALSFAGLLACKTTSVESYVDSSSNDICEAVIACNCEYPNGALLDHCIGQLSVNFESAAQINIIEGLSFDGDCADKALADIKELGCGVAQVDPDAECEAPCKLWHGPVGKGGTCTAVDGYDNCKQGLTCGGDGVCVSPCAEPKLPEIGELCGQLLGCVEGAFCNFDAELNPVCEPLPGANAPCTEDEQLCAEGLICDTTNPDNRVCATPPALGAECLDFQCAKGLYCDGSKTPAVCAAVPGLGEQCPVGACQAPYVCNPANICVEPPPQICGAYGGLPLDDCKADQFTCNNGMCIPTAQLCDGVPQCNDGSDEAPENFDCPAPCDTGFSCDDGACLDLGAVCDGFPDCADGTDEPANCP